ncbi:hypothetical protein ACSBR2_039649 [Camellia fascicularis]
MNNFHGNIPSTFTEGNKLRNIDLNGNQLEELQVLVFKSNKFHGPVDSFKTKLLFPKLRIFDLSHNEFSGRLPTTDFKLFNAMKMVDEKVERKYMGQSYYSD